MAKAKQIKWWPPTERDALERWTGHVRDIVSPSPENVVRMEHTQ